MSSKFCITSLEPDVLASKISKERKRLGWSVAELAREASVEFSSVARVEDPNQEPGILTSLNVALAAKVVDLSGIEPEAEALDFALQLGTDTKTAASTYQAVAEDYLAEAVGGREFVPTNLFYLYTAEPKLARLRLANPRGRSSSRSSLSTSLVTTPLPEDLGNISSDCLRIYRRAGSRSSSKPVPAIKNSEVTFWSHLSVGRTVNVGARRLIASIRIIEDLLGKQEKQQAMSKQDYRDLATRAFVNHYFLEKAYKAQLAKSGLKAMPDFWKLMYDFLLMRSVVYPAEAAGQGSKARNNQKIS